MSAVPFSPYKGFIQIAYVTNDFDRSLKYFAERHGIPKFMELRDLSIEIQPGKTALNNIGLAFVGDVQIEIINPLSGECAIYKDPLPEKEFAVRFHHVAQLIDTEEEYEAQREAQRKLGKKIAIDGASPGNARYFYTDYRDELGHYIEHIWYSEQGRAMFPMIPRI